MRSEASRGFTLLEVLVVVIIFTVTLGVVSVSFARYVERTSARRAAELFGRDLTLARTTSVRGRRTVVVAFDEADRSYCVRIQGGDTLVVRRFDNQGDLKLSSIDLEFQGDSVAFDSDGLADLSGGGGPLGEALFQSGNSAYAVSFNSMGLSRIDES